MGLGEIRLGEMGLGEMGLGEMGQNPKFEVRSFTLSWDNRGYWKNFGSLWIRPRSFFPKFRLTLQHNCYVEMTSSTKTVADNDGHLTKTFKRKTWHCKSIAKRIREQKLESSLTKSLKEKLTNSVLCGSGPRWTWSRCHCSVKWCRAVAASQHALTH